MRASNRSVITIRFLLAALLLVTALALPVSPAAALSVENIRVGQHPDKIRLVVDLDARSEFRVFMMDDPWRLAIDLPAFSWNAGTIARPPGSLIKNVRQGVLTGGISRIVIDLDSPAVVRGVFFLPRAGALPDRLVVDYTRAPEEEARAARDKIYGRLKVSDQKESYRIVSGEPGTKEPPAPPPRPEMPVAEEKSEKTKDMARDVAGVPPPATVVPARKPGHVTTDHVTTGESVAAPSAPRRPGGQKPLIVIDPGHGGEDPGAISPQGLKEKNIALAVSRELKKQLEATGRYRVKLTREKDIFMRLSRRVAFAREQKGDLFVSIHADSINRDGVRGASVYTLSEKASDEQTEMLALRENRADLIAGVDLTEEDDLVANILVDLTMRDTMNQSKFLANTLVDIMGDKELRLLENPHRSAGFAVLKAPDIPSILVELGFMSNNKDASLLAGQEHQQKLARALAASIDAYFVRIDEATRL